MIHLKRLAVGVGILLGGATVLMFAYAVILCGAKSANVRVVEFILAGLWLCYCVGKFALSLEDK